MNKLINQHKKVHFGSIRAFREIWKSTVIFSGQNDTGHYFSEKWISKAYEDFEIIFRIPVILSANNHFRRPKFNSNFHLVSLFNYYLYLFIFIKFNYLYYYYYDILLLLLLLLFCFDFIYF